VGEKEMHTEFGWVNTVKRNPIKLRDLYKGNIKVMKIAFVNVDVNCFKNRYCGGRV
jgi:hypothetical protein